MKKFLFLVPVMMITATALWFGSCQKKAETTATPNIATAIVSNLSTISSGITPTSLASNTASGVSAQADPCAGVTDFAICQSNLIRAYIQISKQTVDAVSTIVNSVGQALGQIPDGNTGTSSDGKITWNKTSESVWSVLARSVVAGNPYAYLSISGSTYTLKIDANNAETPKAEQIEVVVTFNSAADWVVDVFFRNEVCDTTEVGKPSKAHIKLTKASGLWTGKAMLYSPRWTSPGATALTCGATAGTSDIAMYTDFVGNDTSTKAALYMMLSTENTTNLTTIGNFDLADFCSTFPASCGGGGQPTAGALAAYPNNWCTTGAGTNPLWGNNCTTNTAVSAASFSSNTLWTTPLDLKAKNVSLPTSL